MLHIHSLFSIRGDKHRFMQPRAPRAPRGDKWETCGAQVWHVAQRCAEHVQVAKSQSWGWHSMARLKELLFLEYGYDRYENVAMHRRCPANNRRRKTVQNRVGCLLKRASNEFDTTTSNARESNPGFRSWASFESDPLPPAKRHWSSRSMLEQGRNIGILSAGELKMLRRYNKSAREIMRSKVRPWRNKMSWHSPGWLNVDSFF